MGYEELKNYIKLEENQVGTGIDRFGATANVYYEQVYRDPPVPAQKLLPILRKYDPTFQVTEEDRSNAEIRKARSQKARDMIRNIEVSRCETLADLGFRSRYRFDMFFLTFSPEAREENMKWAKLFESGTLQEQADAVYRHITEKVRPMVEKSLTMNEDELVENITPLHNYLSLVAEMTRIISQFPFSEEQKKEMEPLVELQQAAISLRRRVDVMASTYYESLPLERLYIKKNDKDAFTEEMGAFASKNDKFSAKTAIPFRGPVDALADDVVGNSIWAGGYIRDRIVYSLNKAGGDGRMIYGMDGALLDDAGVTAALEKNEPLFVVTPDKGMTPFAASLTALPDAIAPGDAQVAPAMARKTRQMLQQIKDATPWWMTTGSQEFHAMESAMTAFADAAEGLTFPPQKEQAERLRQAAQSLRQASETYQNFKLQQRMGSLDSKDSSAADKLFDQKGNLLGKNKRETSRLQAARALTDLTIRAEFFLSCADPAAAAEKARAEMARKDAEAARKAEVIRKEKEAILKRSAEQRMKDQVPEGERCNASLEQLREKVSYYKNLPRPEPLYDGDSLPQLHDKLTDQMETMCKLAIGNRNIKDNRKAMMILSLGRLVTYHLVMNERVLNTNKATGKPDGPGSIEKALLVNEGCPLADDKDFQAILDPMTPARLEKIILQDEAKTLGQKYLDRLAQKEQKRGMGKQITKENKMEMTDGAKKGSGMEAV